MLRRKLFVAALAAAVAGLLGPASARAGFSITATVGGSTATITDNNTGNTSSGTVGGVLDTSTPPPPSNTGLITTPTVQGNGTHDPAPFMVGGVLFGLTATSNDATPQAAVQALLSTTSNIVVYNGSGSAQTFTLTISNDQLTQPGVAGLNYILTNSLTIQQFFNGGIGSSSSSTGSVFSVGAAEPDAVTTGSVGGSNGLFATSTAVYHRTATPYTMSQTYTITLASGEAVKFQGSVDATAVPAPATAVLALAGAPIFGVFGWMRRRKVVVA